MPPEPSAVEPQPEPNGPTLKPLVTVPSWRPPVERELRSSSSRHRERDVVSVSRIPKPSPKRSPKQTPPSKLTVADQDGAQPACPICLDDLVEPQMLGCGHLYCAKCIATHASVQLAANRPVNCPCCLRPVAPTEMHAWASPPRQPRTSSVPRGVRVRGRARQPSWNEVVTACAASRSAAEWSEAAASSSTVEAPALSREEQRAFRRAAVRLKLRRCPSCDAPVQKNGGCNHMSCLCGAEFQWSRATPFVACQTYHYDSDKGRYCCQHCSPTAYAKLGAVRLATGAAIAPVATVAAAAAATVVVAGGSVAAAVAVVPAAVFGPPALVYEPIRRATRLKEHRNGLKMAAGSGVVAVSRSVEAMFLCAYCGSDSD